MFENLITVDVETTGLDYIQDRVLEVAYKVGDGETKTFYPQYHEDVLTWCSRRGVESGAFEVNQWNDRFGGDVNNWPNPIIKNHSLSDEEQEFLATVAGKYLVGLNVNFDANMLRGEYGDKFTPHHRQISVGTMAIPVAMSDANYLGIADKVPTDGTPLNGGQVGVLVDAIHQELFGYSPEGIGIDHTATGDVDATWFYYKTLHQWLSGRDL